MTYSGHRVRYCAYDPLADLGFCELWEPERAKRASIEGVRGLGLRENEI